MEEWDRGPLDRPLDETAPGRRLPAGRTLEAEVLRQLFAEASRLTSALERRGNEMVRGLEQTYSRWQVLDLAHERPRAVPQVARQLGLTRQAVQRLADLLVKEKLALYRGNPAHRRSPLLQATPRGEEMLERIDSLRNRWINRMANGLLRKDIDTTLRTVRGLFDRLERIPVAPFTRKHRRGGS